MTYGEGQEDGGDLSFRVDSSARSDQQDNLGGEEVVSAGKLISDLEYAVLGVMRTGDLDRVNAAKDALRAALTTAPVTGHREHFALTAALAENERLREALTLMLPLARNWNGQRWSQNTSEAITKAEAALKGPQQ
jgi:hypothetical protein